MTIQTHNQANMPTCVLLQNGRKQKLTTVEKIEFRDDAPEPKKKPGDKYVLHYNDRPIYSNSYILCKMEKERLEAAGTHKMYKLRIK